MTKSDHLGFCPFCASLPTDRSTPDIESCQDCTASWTLPLRATAPARALIPHRAKFMAARLRSDARTLVDASAAKAKEMLDAADRLDPRQDAPQETLSGGAEAEVDVSGTERPESRDAASPALVEPVRALPESNS